MFVYFVRHGQTTHNLSRKKQHPHTQLTELGERQALQVASRLSSLPIEAVYTSHYDRAVSTAAAITQTLNLPPAIVLDNLHELRNPESVHDMHFDDPAWLSIETEINNHIHDPEWHYADEENYYDLHQRAQKILSDISKVNHQNIAVVTHGGTLRALLYTLIMGDRWDSQIFDHIYHHTKTENTSLTIFEYTNKNSWRLISWNDHSHL